jgi:hypothetical protein
MIFNSFEVLFNQALSPGGLYFIEDLCFSRYPERLWIPKSKRGIIMVDVIKEWIEQLLTPNNDKKNVIEYKYNIPKNIKWISCQFDACVIAKCLQNDVAQCS